ncbi:MAG: Long-chain-fatty-acid--CoA ligase [Alphaproteobacteria bacterium MarineAlpha9_Bin3]|nr:MAG: Long-chain-fatty-acid--CoA ligase [Alphaproteobacteria bacterium MarineAlpha9_Bin3]|tara:strand:+ start:20945 stop:22447 length:1503 start_codon:yes stop_codon:yes gene_type:complete
MDYNLYLYIEKNALKSPSSIAISSKNNEISYHSFLQNIDQFVDYLFYTLHLRKGDRIAILVYNRIEFISLFYACAKLGIILVPINWRLTSSEITHIIKDVGTKYLFSDKDFIKTLKIIKNKIHKFKIIDLDEIKFNTAIKYKRKCIKNYTLPLLIVYTSGTTGSPKGAVLSQSALYFNILNSINMHKFNSKSHILTVIPLFHVGGLNIQTIPALHLGAKVTIHKKFEINETFQELKKSRITHTVFVPTILELLIKSRKWDTNIFSSLKAITTGSTIVSSDLIKAYEKKKIPIIQVYGSTETAPIAICQKITNNRLPFGNVGKVAKYNKAKIFDKNFKPTPMGTIGEIGIKGLNLFSYYWKDKYKSKCAFKDGWFMTGDYGKKDKNNQFYIVGRKENIIISGGENIYPAEIEKILNKENKILESAVFGIPDKKWQEIPIAFVKIDSKSKFNLSQCKSNLEKKLASYKIPKKILLIEEIPRNALGKIDYKLLREYHSTLNIK